MSFTNASIYENAEDLRTSRWKLVSAKDVSSVRNVWDLSKKSHVIEFQGEGTKHSYELKIKNQSYSNEHWLTWDMKFSKDFVIIVLLETNMGEYHLVYTPGTFKGYMQYGLGYPNVHGKWKKIQRNLLEDIAYFDNRVKTVSLKSFVIKANGRIDNIMTQSRLLPPKKKVQTRKIIEKKHKLETTHTVQKEYKPHKVLKNSLPTIELKGIRLVKLSYGEEYIEKGVSAYDKEDGEISVESSNDINPYLVGRYMVLYMARDSNGNIAVDKRYVEVGDVKSIRKKAPLDRAKPEVIVEEIDDKEEVDYLVQEEQIRMWEKELALREKELARKENKSNKN